MNFLKSIRFSADISTSNYDVESPITENNYMQDFLHSSVLVSENTFPRFFKVITEAFDNMKQEYIQYPFFIQPSLEMQASCIKSSENATPLFLFTSALLEKLNDDELKFVIGHEFAHFCFRHNKMLETNDPIANLRNMILSRSAEISADRIGLIACKDLQAATGVLIKLATGLDRNNVRFDISAFINQYNRLIKYGPSRYEAMSSHPLFLIRLRALVLFSRTKQYLEQTHCYTLNQINISDVDKQLCRDFSKLAGVSLDNIENTLITRVMLYGVFLVFANDGKINKDEQDFIKEHFGDVDFSDIMELLNEKGIDGLSYEFKSLLTYVHKSNIDKPHLDKLNEFFEIIINTYNQTDTKLLQDILNNKQ